MNALRHSWVKVKAHNYICRRCGMRKVNVESAAGWQQEWHTPDGDVVVLRFAPSCAVGPETAARLAWLTDWQSRQPAGAPA